MEQQLQERGATTQPSSSYGLGPMCVDAPTDHNRNARSGGGKPQRNPESRAMVVRQEEAPMAL